MGGTLLPLQCVTVELTEHSSGFFLTGAQLDSSPLRGSDIASFLAAQEGVELLLALLQDDDPLPEVFDASVTFLTHCKEDAPSAFLAFAFSLLSLLGLLPEMELIENWGACSSQEQAFIEAAMEGRFVPCDSSSQSHLQSLLKNLLAEHLNFPLKVGEMAARFR